MSKRQAELPGVERKTLRDVESAADEFIEATDKFKRVGEDKKAAQEKLVMAMQRNKIRSYRYDSKLLTLEELERVKVKSDKEDNENG